MKKLSKITAKPTKRYPALMYTEQTAFLVQADKKGDEFILFKETPLPKGLLINGDVVDIAKFGAFLAEFIKQATLKDKHIIVGLPELKATTQSLTLPTMGSEEMTQAVESQASSFLPFPLEDAYIDWRFETHPEEGDAVVLVSAIPKTVIDNHVKALQVAELIPIAFETTAVSLSRALPSNAPNPNVALEYTGSTATVIINNNKAIEVSSVLQDGNTLVNKLHRLINYFLKQQKEGEQRPIAAVYLSGKNITQQFVTQIKQELNIEPVLLSAQISNIANERQSELALLAILARKDAALPESGKTINLLPKDRADVLVKEKKSKLESAAKYSAVGFLVLFIALSVFTLITLMNKTSSLAQEVESLSTQQGKSIVFNPAKVALIVATGEENKQLSTITAIVLDKAPAGVFLSAISFDTETDNIIISGTAADRDKLLAYRDRLEALDEISNVEIPLSSLEQEINVLFRLQISL